MTNCIFDFCFHFGMLITFLERKILNVLLISSCITCFLTYWFMYCVLQAVLNNANIYRLHLSAFNICRLHLIDILWNFHLPIKLYFQRYVHIYVYPYTRTDLLILERGRERERKRERKKKNLCERNINCLCPVCVLILTGDLTQQPMYVP